MARSLSLAAYMALAKRAPHNIYAPEQPRPKGELLWAHATSPAAAAALQNLTARLLPLRPGLHLLLTTPPEMARPEHLGGHVIWQGVPDESVININSFLEHWQPDLCLWSGGFLRPALIRQASETGIPLFLVDAQEAGFEETRWRWLPDLARSTLRCFDAIFAGTANAAQRLLKLGVAPETITITGPLQEGAAALPCNEAERNELANMLTGRPVWLAAMAQRAEIPIIAEAHRVSLRGAHRQLLVLVPDNETQGDEIAALLSESDWRVAQWSKGEYPTEITQILLADTRGEMGLWYRLAPITFMASSLVSGHGGRDPFEPAALGSAILYGPNVGRYLDSYSRLANAGAARIVKDADTLAAAVARLTAPDQAAAMAHAAWDVASLGADVTDNVIDLVQDILDLRETA